MRQLIKQRIKNEKGLTLIELLAVIVILGIIAAIAIPSISGIIQKSKEDAVKADAITILNAAKNYVAGNDMAAGGEIKKADLATYVSGTNLEKFGEYTVNVSSGATSFELNATQVEAGKRNITFTNATIKEINDAKITDADTTIGD
ncbi:prepilin-type N-terminal cleavage/methylation domain-containing protein [Niallia alba]|uniref:prepilin-type N-terminal cleavage/methylation domain-containing protein n=1 Tax=Niallia alba TaxID=2729105 RepID=UPI00399FBD61